MLVSNCAVCVKKKSTLMKNKELHNFDQFKMNKTINKFLLAGDKFMLEQHLKQPGFTHDVLGPFTKHRERIQICRETGNLKHLFRKELDKNYFAHDTAYCDSKDLAKRTISDKILKDRVYEIARNCNYDGSKSISNMVYKFFDKKTGSGISVNEELADELHKPVIKKFKRRKVYKNFKDNIWVTDLIKMVSLPTKNKSAKYLLCVIDVFNNMKRLNL